MQYKFPYSAPVKIRGQPTSHRAKPVSPANPESHLEDPSENSIHSPHILTPINAIQSLRKSGDWRTFFVHLESD